MMKLIKQFWGWCVFLVSMAVVGLICFVIFVFAKDKVDDAARLNELIDAKVQIIRVVTKKDKKDNSLPALWTEVKVLKSGRSHELEGDLGAPKKIITVKIARHLTLTDAEKSSKTDVEKKKAEEDARKARKKAR